MAPPSCLAVLFSLVFVGVQVPAHKLLALRFHETASGNEVLLTVSDSARRVRVCRAWQADLLEIEVPDGSYEAGKVHSRNR